MFLLMQRGNFNFCLLTAGVFFTPHWLCTNCSWHPQMLHRDKNEHPYQAAAKASHLGQAEQHRCL